LGPRERQPQKQPLVADVAMVQPLQEKTGLIGRVKEWFQGNF